MKIIHKAAYLLLWAGGLNWGLMGLFKFNLVSALFGTVPALETLIYVLVGASVVYTIALHKGYCKECSST